jgi:hypothetical protein
MVAMPITTRGTQSEPTGLVLSIVGIMAHLILIVAAIRGSGWIEHWDKRMAELELLDSEESNPNGVRVRVFSHRGLESFKAKGRNLNRAFEGIGILFALFWVEECMRLLGLFKFIF